MDGPLPGRYCGIAAFRGMNVYNLEGEELWIS